MINRQALLADVQKLLRTLEADLRARCDEVAEAGAAVRAEYDAARKAERTAQSFEEWRTDYVTQITAAWVLGCVFARFLEDNRLVDPPRLSGPAERLRRARDEHELYFRAHPAETDREYLLDVFDGLVKLPGGRDIFGEHNPIHQQRGWLSGDAARELLSFFQRIEPESGKLVYDFTDSTWDTRFLGDLYQDLSEAARKKYALLQTPEFVEEFILDRTLEPAIEEFGLVVGGQSSETDNCQLSTDNCFRMIDPACGSGHFLLGGFHRLFDRWSKAEPGTNRRELVQRALDSVHGVDLNPYAVAIARFRLLLAALRLCGIERLADAPAFRMNLACGDSLLHGTGAPGTFGFDEYDHVYQVEDREELIRILQPGRYHAVVANPPYITPKDKALNQAYRNRYSTCHMKYALTVPFMQRLFQLATSGYGDSAAQGGYVGQITSNSFMKREFGKKIIEQYLAGRDGGPSVDLTHVIDTSGAYIPGHGTPTVILFGRNRPAVMKTIRTVMGIRGEPSTPADPARGHVWSAIVNQIDHPGSQSEFVSVGDSSRELFAKHPWSIGGGGAAELKDGLDIGAPARLADVIERTGIGVVTLEDEAFAMDAMTLHRWGLGGADIIGFVEGDRIRDWIIDSPNSSIFPYAGDHFAVSCATTAQQALWPLRTNLKNRIWFSKTQEQRGMAWFEFGMLSIPLLRTPLSIVFAFVATHNHFVLDRGGKVFKQSAPVIKLPPEATEDDHLALLGLLNSSTACFWMKQVFHNKGDSTDQHGARTTGEVEFNSYEFAGTGLLKFPLPAGRPLDLARQLDEMAGLLAELSPGNLLRAGPAEHNAQILAERRFQWEAVRQQMIALQEELDWECYGLYGVGSSFLVLGSLEQEPGAATGNQEPTTKNQEPLSPPAIDLGQRAFEIVLARRMAGGEVQSTWFKRHGSTPITEVPEHWPADYKRLVEQRMDLIEKDRNIGLIEQPEYKRRWNTEPWESQLERALREWLLDRLEGYFDFDERMRGEKQRGREAVGQREEHFATLPLCCFAPGSLTTTARLADVAARDANFMQVAELYRGRKDFDVGRLVAELVEDESVPCLPTLRYKPAAKDKRRAWERTWELQREEDERGKGAEESGKGAEGQRGKGGERSGPLPLSPSAPLLDIPVPPKYTSADFQKSSYWRLRGKLDVPKERWVSFPHCEGEDQTLVVAWAGYDHLQLARAVGVYYLEMKQQIGGGDDPRLVPLLGCIAELLPWLKQWHNDVDPEFNMRMGDYYENFVHEEARQLGKTTADIKAWTPPKKSGGRRTRKGSP